MLALIPKALSPIQLTWRLAHAADSDEDSEEEAEEVDEDDAEVAAAGERLNEVYERLQEVGSATAEARAAKILHGLGAPPKD